MTHKPAILAIDDTPANLKTLGAVLMADYDLRVASSGAEGLIYAAAAPPDLILLDIMMPVMDGFEVFRGLKADARLRHIPVIFITAMSESEAETIGLELGAADFLSKPINVPIARLRIRNLLEREDLRKKVAAHRDQLEAQVKERTLSLSVAKEAAEGANRLKAAILANISHEFRTPMSAILGMLGMARRRTDDPRITDCLVKAEQAANLLLGTLTGMLDLALAESNRLPLERTPFRITDISASAVNRVAAVAASKGIAIVNRDASITPPPEWLVGDPVRITEILRELLDNAIKFSSMGTILVESFVETDASGRLWMGYRVGDEGIGIARENLQRIFEPFQQVDGSSTRQYGGNGIGLALCRQLARHMGGSIAVASELGRGSTFTLRLPVEPRVNAEPDGAPAPEVESLLRSRHAGASVLVAEDDPSIRLLMAAILEDAGLTAIMVNDGVEAIEAARSLRFDIVLVDLMMPRVSGIEAARTIRAIPHSRATPIVAVTARAFEEDRVDCLRAGIDAHIPKPFAPEVLLSVVLEWLDRGKRTRATQ